MSRVDLHPEELLDRARSGTASKEELARARAHVASCAACSIEQTLLVEIERSVAPQPHDDLVAARIRSFVARQVEERGQLGASAAPRRKARKWAVFAFAATLLLTTIGAAMVMMRERQRSIDERGGSGSTAAMTPRAAVARVHEVAAPEPPSPEPQGAAELPPDQGAIEARDPRHHATERGSDDSSAPRTGQRPSRTALKPERGKPTESAQPERSAAELFARANLLRRRDEVSDAVAVYRELQRSFPGSAEELLSRVVLGRLLLDRLGDPNGALAQFESYLASSSQGSLREEALVGRAVALGRLGRVAEERGAWSALLDAYPKSTSAARARAKLAAPVAP